MFKTEIAVSGTPFYVGSGGGTNMRDALALGRVDDDGMIKWLIISGSGKGTAVEKGKEAARIEVKRLIVEAMGLFTPEVVDNKEMRKPIHDALRKAGKLMNTYRLRLPKTF